MTCRYQTHVKACYVLVSIHKKVVNYFQFICDNNNSSKRILNKAVQSFPAPFMSISTPVNAQQNTHSEVQLNSTFKAYSFETQTEPKNCTMLKFISYLQDEISCRDQCCTHGLLELSKYNLQFYAV
jgi:hypothetical protein